MTTQTYIASEVRAELARQGHTQTWLAEQLDKTDVWVSRRLQGHVPLSAADLAAIADLLNAPITAFLPAKESA